MQDILNKANLQVKTESARLSRSIMYIMHTLLTTDVIIYSKRLSHEHEEYDFLRELLKDVPEEEDSTQSLSATPNSFKRKATSTNSLKSANDTSNSDTSSEKRKEIKAEGKKPRSRIKISELVSSDADDN